jgi:hypothetical protein
MYSTRSGLVLAFHGCDRSVANAVINSKIQLKESENDYDWLGHGIYFWENSPSRAFEYANYLHKNPGRAKHPVKEPAVIGAVINLGFCLDLLDYENLQLLRLAWQILTASQKQAGIPENKVADNTKELLIRNLDCAVIEMLHNVRRSGHQPAFDSVRGVFWEGEELYPNAGFREKDHIQICVRNPNCIKGFFLPRIMDENHPRV